MATRRSPRHTAARKSPRTTAVARTSDRTSDRKTAALTTASKTRTSARKTTAAKTAAAKAAAAKTAAAKTAARKSATRKGAARATAAGKGAAAKNAARKSKSAAPSRRAASAGALFAPLAGAEGRTVGHVRVDVGRAGAARVKRMIYPPGFHWAADMKPITGTDLCMHAHVGFLAHGEIHIEYADGCIVEFRAPQVVAIDPGHDGWVVGSEPVVLIEFDFERDTIATLGMPEAHRH